MIARKEIVNREEESNFEVEVEVEVDVKGSRDRNRVVITDEEADLKLRRLHYSEGRLGRE